jgi:hypothetical protein
VSSPQLRADIWVNSAAEPAPTPDLDMQYEDILVCIWRAEANWIFDDKLNLAVGAATTTVLGCRR